MQLVAEFVTSAAGAADFPRDRLPEIALIGRSNVGKSTLINALVRRKLARTSGAPGKTRLANFYRVQRSGSASMYLVDLPGYGYSRAPRRGAGAAHAGRNPADARERASREFDQLAEDYFARSGQGGADHPSKELAVLLLVDSRHPGLESDLNAWAWLASLPCPRGIVGTKVDKLSRADRVRCARELDSYFDSPVLLVSAETGEGLDELWKLIARLPRLTAA